MEAQFYSKRDKSFYACILFLSLTASPLISKANNFSTKSYNTFPAVTLRDSVVKSLTVNVSCNAGANGKATIGVKNGTSPYTYTWTPNVSSTGSATGLSAGTYSVSVMDAMGNSGTTAVVTITQPSLLRDSIATNSGVGCSGGNGGSAKVGVKGGTSPYFYAWSNGSTMATASNLSAGSYSVTITDKLGCSHTVSTTITQPNVITDNLGSLTNPSCNGGLGSATINISGGTSPYTFTWTHGYTTTATATNLTPGSYTVTVKDAHSCSGPAVTFTVTQPLAIRDSSVTTSKVNLTCNGGNTGSARIGVKYGVQPYTYTWSPNVSSLANATGLSAGTYSVTVTDNNGCSSTTSVTITQPLAMRDSVTNLVNPACSNSNGVVTLGVKNGTAPYTYLWSDGGTTSRYTYMPTCMLSAGAYNITVTDNHGCNAYSNVNVVAPSLLLANASIVTNVTCKNQGKGSAMVSPAGGTPPYNYLWAGETTATTALASNLNMGIYTVTVTDANGCRATDTLALTMNVPIDSIASITGPLCYGGLGSVHIGVAGGAAPYTYIWGFINNTSSDSLNNLVPDVVYQVAVQDAQGCYSAPISFTITQPNPLIDSISSIICTDSLIEASIGVSGGTAPYAYQWSPGNGSSQTVSGLTPGIYTITVTDANGCSNYITQNVSCKDMVLHKKVGQDKGGNITCCATINLYPNPNSGQFNLAGLEAGETIEIYDYTGRKISGAVASDVSIYLNMADQPNGIYLMRIMDKDGNLLSRKKVVKTN